MRNSVSFSLKNINSPVCCQPLFDIFIPNFIFGLDLKKLASALTSKLWPRSWPQDRGLGLEMLVSFNIAYPTI